MDMEECDKVQRIVDESKFRQFYDPLEGIMDFGKKTVTDYKYNSKEGLAKEVEKKQESYMELRRNRS